MCLNFAARALLFDFYFELRDLSFSIGASLVAGRRGRCCACEREDGWDCRVAGWWRWACITYHHEVVVFEGGNGGYVFRHAARMTGMLWTWYTHDRYVRGMLHTWQVWYRYAAYTGESCPLSEIFDYWRMSIFILMKLNFFFFFFYLSSYPFPSVKYPLRPSFHFLLLWFHFL